MKRKMIACMLALTMAMGMLAGCGAGEKSEKAAAKQDKGTEESGEMKIPEEITLYTYYTDSEVPIVDKTLERLKKIYPDLTIHIEHRTDADGTVLKTRAAVGELPDIFECTGQLTEILRKSEDLVELDSAIEEKELFSKFLDNNFDVKKAEDGHYYAIDATKPEGCLIYYNTEVFDKLNLEEPKNFDEFKEVVSTLKKNDVIPLALFAQEKWPGLQMYDMAVIGQGQYLGLTGLEDGQTKITDPEYAEAAQKVEEIISLGLIGQGALNTNASQAFELMGTGKAGMLINGSWFFDDAIAGGWAENIDYFKFNPFSESGKEEETQWHMSGGSGSEGGYAVSAKGEYAEFCKQVVVDWVYERAIVSAEQGRISALKETIEPAEQRPASYQDFADHVKDIKSNTKFEFALNNRELISALEDSSELLNVGSYTAKDFIDTLSEQIPETME